MSSPASRPSSASLLRAPSPGWRGGALFLLVALTLTACAAATPQKRAFQTLTGLNDTVEAGMRSAGTLYANGVIGEQQKGKIVSLYTSYSHAAQAAALALKASNGGDPVVILRAVQDAVDELISFIESISRKPMSQSAAPIGPQPTMLIGPGGLP